MIGEVLTVTRNERLAEEYREMLRIQDTPYLSWRVLKGELPYAEEYLLDVRIRTYVFSAKKGVCTVGAIRRCIVKVTLRDSFPHTAPYIKMLNIPPVFHPDWYSKGTYCSPETWRPECSLKNFVLRMIDTLRYEPSIIRTEAPANYKALEWYLKNRGNTLLFPSDTTELTEKDPQECAAAENGADAFDEIVDTW